MNRLEPITETRFTGFSSEQQGRPEEADNSLSLLDEARGTYTIGGMSIQPNEINDSQVHIEREGFVEPTEVYPLSSLVKKREFLHMPSQSFIKILRNHFLPSLLEGLEDIQPYTNSPDAAVYVDNVLHSIRRMEMESPLDPLLEILFAFYDAVAYNGLWAKYSKDQYANARKIFVEASERSSLSREFIENAILELEKIGFDTTPIPLESE